MGESALENAEKRRDRIAADINALQAKIEQKRKELERVNAFISDYQMFASGEPELELGQTLSLPSVPVPIPKKHVNPDKEIVGDAVERILRANKRPMSRDTLFREVMREGLDIQGKDPLMVFSTMLWRMPKRFVRLGGKVGYWLTQEPCPEVNYVPPPPPPAL
ncbi:MAG: hypothetical protein HY852_11810 [Bradyrhizobium sp.]|uniref:hypothetical protein n=1 Tax=Bradyrhizobium sp. TaxID=376 RepID=UPI0025C6DEEE|nr:hypothetical protein [Bradyrhizobium sp.]MBI5262488.1 hypothetical protein [Bradyrhizobium sp.]